jgi:hypothetical protein
MLPYHVRWSRRNEVHVEPLSRCATSFVGLMLAMAASSYAQTPTTVSCTDAGHLLAANQASVEYRFRGSVDTVQNGRAVDFRIIHACQ